PAWIPGRVRSRGRRRAAPVGTRLAWAAEGIWVMIYAARCDGSSTRSELAIEYRPLEETFETIRRLGQGGQPTPAGAGASAGRPPAPRLWRDNRPVPGFSSTPHRRTDHADETVPVTPGLVKTLYQRWGASFAGEPDMPLDLWRAMVDEWPQV